MPEHLSPDPAPVEREDREQPAPAVPARDIAVAGAAATAVAFGPARMGFGLHLPQFKDDFAISDSVAGLISGALFGAFLAATLLASWFVARRGTRAPVVTGCLLALVGAAVVAIAPGPTTLALGVVVAGGSAGLCWSPFNDAAARSLPEARRGTPLATVSTGTTLGVASAGAMQLLVLSTGLSWRWAWAGYAVAAALAAAIALIRLPRLPGRPGEQGVRPRAVQQLGRKIAWPFGAAASFGLTSSLFFSFAADRTADAGGLPGIPREAAAGVLFVVFGLAGMLGLLTAVAERRSGLRALLTSVFVAAAVSLALLAAAPTLWPAVLASAALQGAVVMVVSAILAFWTARLYPHASTTAFTVVLVALAGGSVIGPAVAGALLQPLGGGAVFAGAATVAALTAAAIVVADPPDGVAEPRRAPSS